VSEKELSSLPLEPSNIPKSKDIHTLLCFRTVTKHASIG
jgi:hypothetical protein